MRTYPLAPSLKGRGMVALTPALSQGERGSTAGPPMVPPHRGGARFGVGVAADHSCYAALALSS